MSKRALQRSLFSRLPRFSIPLSPRALRAIDGHVSGEVLATAATVMILASFAVIWYMLSSDIRLFLFTGVSQDTVSVVVQVFLILLPGAVAYFLISEILLTRAKLTAQLKLSAELLDNTSDSVFVHDEGGRFQYVSATACSSLGYSRAEMMAMNRRDLVAPAEAAGFEAHLIDVFEKGEGTFESIILRKDGREFPVEVHARLLHLGGRDVVLSVCRDITSRKAHEMELVYTATHDELTGLLNRSIFIDRANQAIAICRRYTRNTALLLLDLDGFKSVNDSMGHAAGDEVLKSAGQRLTGLLRSSDSVGRVGGDEFGIVLSEVTSAEGAVRVARTVLEKFREPFSIGDQALTVTVSIGVAVFPEDGGDYVTLSKHADDALYRAKANGRDGYSSCSETGGAPREQLTLSLR